MTVIIIHREERASVYRVPCALIREVRSSKPGNEVGGGGRGVMMYLLSAVYLRGAWCCTGACLKFYKL
jgi:hypothetical protein